MRKQRQKPTDIELQRKRNERKFRKYYRGLLSRTRVCNAFCFCFFRRFLCKNYLLNNDPCLLLNNVKKNRIFLSVAYENSYTNRREFYGGDLSDLSVFLSLRFLTFFFCILYKVIIHSLGGALEETKEVQKV